MSPFVPPILIVDDAAEDRALAARAFQQNQIQNAIIQLSSGQACLDYFRGEGEFSDRQIPAFVLIDLAMPIMTGVDVLKKLKNNPVAEKSIFVMLSGVSDLKIVHKGYLAGAVTFLVKPLHARELMLMLDKVKGVSLKKSSKGYKLLLSDEI